MRLFPALMVVIFTVLAAICFHDLLLSVEGQVKSAVASWRLIVGGVTGVLVAAFFLCVGTRRSEVQE